jgi:hypothetical protein
VRAGDGPGHSGARGRNPLTPEPGHASRRGHSPGAICPLRRTRSHPDAPVAVATGITSATSAADEARSSMLVRSCLEDTHLRRLAQDLQDMASGLGPCIQKEHAMVGPRHLARPRHLAVPDLTGVGHQFARAAWQSYAVVSSRAAMRCLDEPQRVMYDGRPHIIGPRAAGIIQVKGGR